MDTRPVKLSELTRKLNQHPQTGLTSEQAAALAAAHGKNVLFPKSIRKGNPILAFFAEPMVWLLGVAAAVYWALGEQLDAVIMAIAIIPIGFIDMFIEYQTDKALERLEKMGEPKVTVLRNGRKTQLNPDDLVPGDILFVEEGQLVMADCAVLESSDVKVDESGLNGESVPVDKSRQEIFSEEFFANIGTLFAGTRILSGKATCLVVNIGAKTSYGKIGKMLSKTEHVRTKLQIDIDKLVGSFAVLAVVLSILLIGLNLALGQSWSEAILSGVSLAIAAIPEEYPVVFLLFLSMGMLALAKDNALIKRLSAVEALGSINVICTDKTGTLTTGKMTVAEIYTGRRHTIDAFYDREESEEVLLKAAMACEKDPFDYMDKAIYEATRPADALSALGGWELFKEYSFDMQGKYMSHIWKHKKQGMIICAKGSVEGILSRCKISKERRRDIENANRELGEEGIRVLALASKKISKTGSREADEKEMEFICLLGFRDPLRPGIANAVMESQNAGVRVIMLTGDHTATAHAIAHQAGIAHEKVIDGSALEKMSEQEFARTVRDTNVFCRVLPEQKLKIVEALQKLGFAVAVTGDGINDSPALKKADIGVAMGQRGTEVAKEAAAFVLLDDNFATIVNAIRNGRKIYDNLQKAFGYLIAFHVPIFLSALIIPVLGLPLLLMPLHIVFLELVMHPIVSIVFEREPAEHDVMKRKPRERDETILQPVIFARLILIGAVIFTSSLAAYMWAIRSGRPETYARSLAFTAMLFGQVVIVFSELHKTRVSLVHVFSNKSALVAAALSVIAAFALTAVPILNEIFKLSPLDIIGWQIVIVGTMLSFAVAEISKPATKSL